MIDKKILIAGTGGFAKEVLTLIFDLKLEHLFLGFTEPDNFIKQGLIPATVLGYPVIPYSRLNKDDHCIALAIGESVIREKVANDQLFDFEFVKLIHPNATISKWVEIGEGSIICAGCIVTVDVKLGKFTQLNLNTTIGHDCLIDDYFTTAPNVNISGNCTFGKHIYFGTASCIKQGLTICENVTIGMGGVVTKNIEESGVYIGNPVKKLTKK